VHPLNHVLGIFIISRFEKTSDIYNKVGTRQNNLHW